NQPRTGQSNEVLTTIPLCLNLLYKINARNLFLVIPPSRYFVAFMVEQMKATSVYGTSFLKLAEDFNFEFSISVKTKEGDRIEYGRVKRTEKAPVSDELPTCSNKENDDTPLQLSNEIEIYI
uniref:Uncharacterized protein n=1 Tax=Clytia hemisphaerica TaxID=252671 RepID=A0A7M5WXX4_9CNID